MKRCTALALVLLPGLILIGCSSKSVPEPLWIGHLAQLSGTGRVAGKQSRQGVQLAVTDATATGVKVLGRPLEVRHVDTRGMADVARSEAIRLIAVNKVAGLLVESEPAAAERVGREALAYGVPVLVLGELASPPGENVFVLGAGPEARGRALAQVIADESKIDKVAVLVDGRNALAGALVAAFVKQCRKVGHHQILELEYLNDEDLKERVSRALKARPGVVLVAGSVRDFVRVRSDFHAANLGIPLVFGGEDGDVEGLAAEGAGDAEIYLATAFAADKLSETGRNFARHYQEEFGDPPSLAAALAYDGTRLLFQSMSQVNTTIGTRIREQLAKVEAFDAVTGNLSFKDRQARRPVFVVRRKGGAGKVVKTVAPDE